MILVLMSSQLHRAIFGGGGGGTCIAGKGMVKGNSFVKFKTIRHRTVADVDMRNASDTQAGFKLDLALILTVFEMSQLQMEEAEL